MRAKKWTREQLNALERLTKKHTFGEIAEFYGLSRSAIQMACNRNGISGKQRNRDRRGVADPDFRERIQEKEMDKPKPDPFGPAKRV